MALSDAERRNAGRRMWQTGEGLEFRQALWLAEIASAMKLRHEKGVPPGQAGDNLEASKLFLEAFFSPRECVRVVADACSNELKSRYGDDKTISDLSVSGDIRGVREIFTGNVESWPLGEGNEKLQSFISLFYESRIVMRYMNSDDIRTINDKLLDLEVPGEYLFDSNEDIEARYLPHGTTVSYTNQVILHELTLPHPARGSDLDRYRPVDGEKLLKNYEGESHHLVEKFIQANEHICADPFMAGWQLLKDAGCDGIPIASILRDPEVDQSVRDVARKCAHIAFTANKLGISEIRVGQDSHGTPSAFQRYGSIKFGYRRVAGADTVGIIPMSRKLLTCSPDKSPVVNIDGLGKVEPDAISIDGDGKIETSPVSRYKAFTNIGFMPYSHVNSVCAVRKGEEIALKRFRRDSGRSRL